MVTIGWLRKKRGSLNGKTLLRGSLNRKTLLRRDLNVNVHHYLEPLRGPSSPWLM